MRQLSTDDFALDPNRLNDLTSDIMLQSLNSERITPFRVLIADNQPQLISLQLVIIRSVLGAQFEVQHVANAYAEEIRKLLSANSFDLHVLTLNNIIHSQSADRLEGSPLHDSLSLLKEIRSKTVRPIVAMTGLNYRRLEHMIEQAGADIVLELPFPPQTFRDLLECCLQR